MKRYRPWLAKHAGRLWRAMVHWQRHDGNLLAAGTAYYAVLSLLPLLLVLVSVLGLVFRLSRAAQGAQAELIAIVADRTSPGIAEWLDGVLWSVRERAPVSGPLGFATLLLTAIAVFAQFEKAFDAIWGVEAPESKGVLGAVRNALWQRFRAFVMLVILGTAVVAVALAGLGLSLAGPWLAQLPGHQWAAPIVQAPLGFVADWLLFLLLYKLLPKVPVRWYEAARGALLAALLWEVSRHALAVGLRASQYGAYDVIGAVIILMLWVYAGAAIIFLGAEYVQVLTRERMLRGKAG